MKRILILCFAIIATLNLSAQDNSAAEQLTKYNQQWDTCIQRIDAIRSPLLDLDARYWANQIQEGSVKLNDLEKYSENWVGSKEINKKEIALIKKYLKTGKPISLTQKEKDSLDENTKHVQSILGSNCFPKESSLDDIKTERDKKIDAIISPVRDLRARELTRKVQDKVTTLESLEKASNNWLGSKEESQAVINLVKEYLSTGKKITLTPEELDKLDDNQRQVSTFLNNGLENPAAAALARKNRQIRKIKEPVFELEARYWAYRIDKVKDVTFEELTRYSHNWVGERSYNQKLINKIEENLRTGNTKELTKQENKLLEKTNKQIRKLLK